MMYAFIARIRNAREMRYGNLRFEIRPGRVAYTVSRWNRHKARKRKSGAKIARKFRRENAAHAAMPTTAYRTSYRKRWNSRYRGLQIIMAEVDNLRPAAKQPSAAWTAMAAKVKQLQDLVSG